MCRALLLAACLALAAQAQTRFAREILVPADLSAYATTKIDDFDAPGISSEGIEVACLAYRDTARLYLELEIRNRTGKEIAIAKYFVSADQAGRRLARTPASAAAKDLETEALRPGTPKESHDAGVGLAGLLEAFAQENGTATLPSGDDQTIACTFEAPRNDRDIIGVAVKVADRDFRFRFRPAPLKTRL